MSSDGYDASSTTSNRSGLGSRFGGVIECASRVVDLHGDGAKLADVLTTVVSAEVQIATARHDGTNQGACSTPVAPVCR